MAMSKPSLERGSPVQIVDFKCIPTSKLVFHKAALKEVLKPIGDKPLHILSIAGASRQGKSFLISILINLLSLYEAGEFDPWAKLIDNDGLVVPAFDFRNGVDPLTVGFWIWSRPFILKRSDGTEIAVLVMDTQGVFDSFTSEKDWAMIVGLSLLTSSTVIYNLMSNMQEDSLTVLNNFIEFGMLSLIEAGEDQKPPFQKLMFLIRDWNIPESHSYGSVGGRQFLQKKLKPMEGMANNSKRVRKALSSCFEEIDCFLLPHPGEKAISNGYQGQISVLEEAFLFHIRSLTDDLLISVDSMKEKIIQGKVIQASQLLFLFEKYVGAFNSIKLPEPRTLLDITTEATMDAIARKCVTTFTDQLQEALDTKENLCYLELNELKSLFDQLHTQAVSNFQNSTREIKQEKTKKKLLSIMAAEVLKHYNKKVDELESKKSEFESMAIGEATKAYETSMGQATRSHSLLPSQFADEAKLARDVSCKVLENVVGEEGKKSLSQLTPKLTLVLDELEEKFKDANQSSFENEERRAANIVSTLLEDYSNMLNMAIVSSGSRLTKRRLAEVDAQSVQLVLQKLKGQLSTPNSMLYEKAENMLRDEAHVRLAVAGEKVLELQSQAELDAKNFVEETLFQFQTTFLQFISSTKIPLNNLRTEYHHQKTPFLSRLNNLYQICPEQAQEFYNHGSQEMDRIFDQVVNMIKQDEAAQENKLSKDISLAAAHYYESLYKRISSIPDFSFEQSNFEEEASTVRTLTIKALKNEYNSDHRNYIEQHLSKEMDVMDKKLKVAWAEDINQQIDQVLIQLATRVTEHSNFLGNLLRMGEVSMNQIKNMHLKQLQSYTVHFPNETKIPLQMREEIKLEFHQKLENALEQVTLDKNEGGENKENYQQTQPDVKEVGAPFPKPRVGTKPNMNPLRRASLEPTKIQVIKPFIRRNSSDNPRFKLNQETIQLQVEIHKEHYKNLIYDKISKLGPITAFQPDVFQQIEEQVSTHVVAELGKFTAKLNFHDKMELEALLMKEINQIIGRIRSDNNNLLEACDRLYEYKKSLIDKINLDGTGIENAMNVAMKFAKGHVTPLRLDKEVEAELIHDFETSIMAVINKDCPCNRGFPQVENGTEINSVLLGIDFGNSYSRVAAYVDGTLQIPAANNSFKVPSSSFHHDDEEGNIVGQETKDSTVDVTKEVHRHFKHSMFLGGLQPTDTESNPTTNDYNHVPYVSSILQKLRNSATRLLGSDAINAVLTVPAYFTQEQKEGFRECGVVAGINVLDLLDEHTAAVIPYTLSLAENEENTVMVFDLGAASLQVALFTVTKSTIRVIAVERSTDVGGEQFDSTILEYCIHQHKCQKNMDLMYGPSHLVNSRISRIRAACEASKIKLSTETSTTVFVDKLTDGMFLCVELSQKRFNHISSNHFNKIKTVVRSVMGRAKVTEAKVNNVILAGGCSRIPKIQTILQQIFPGKNISVGQEAEEIVARGAALYAAMICGDLKQIEIS